MRLLTEKHLLDRAVKQFIHIFTFDKRLSAAINNLSRPRLVAFVVAASAFYSLFKRIELVFYWSVIAHGFIGKHALILPRKEVCRASS